MAPYCPGWRMAPYAEYHLRIFPSGSFVLMIRFWLFPSLLVVSSDEESVRGYILVLVAFGPVV